MAPALKLKLAICAAVIALGLAFGTGWWLRGLQVKAAMVKQTQAQAKADVQQAQRTSEAVQTHAEAKVKTEIRYVTTVKEVEKLMELILRLLTSDLVVLSEKNIRLLVLGSTDGLNEKTINAIHEAEEKTKDNSGGTLALCFNYGGQLEISDALKKIIKSNVKADEVNVELIEKNLYHPEVPPIDIIVRTSGEERLSNFMLWRSAYSELMFIDKMWPDMTKQDVTDIITEYSKRARRFGG